MTRVLPFISALFVLFVVGCSAPAPATEVTKTDTSTTTTTTPAETPTPKPADAPAAKGEVKIGMGQDEVKVVKGAPDAERHEHDAKGSHLDIWTYKDATITFTDGMVTKIE